MARSVRPQRSPATGGGRRPGRPVRRFTTACSSEVSSSDASFEDRYQASAEWARVKAGSIEVDGGWRIYSSGPGIYVRLLVCYAFGRRRLWGKRLMQPLLPVAARKVTLKSDIHD